MSLDITKNRLKGHDPSRVRVTEVVDEMVKKYLVGDDRKPAEFRGIVRYLVTFKDKWYSNIDPFFDQTIDQERMFNAGAIKNPDQRIIAYVEVEDFFPRISNMLSNNKTDANLVFLRVDVTEVKKKEGRSIEENEEIFITFADLQNLTGPKFSRLVHKVPKKVPAKEQQKTKLNAIEKAKAALKKCPKGPGHASYSDKKKRCECHSGYWWNGAKCYCPKKKGSGAAYKEETIAGVSKCVRA